MLCSYSWRDTPVIKYADRGASVISCVVLRGAFAVRCSDGEMYGRKRMRQDDSTEIPAARRGATQSARPDDTR
jgi:hypothetical protein